MMVSDVDPQHAENTHFMVKIQIPESMQRFQDKTLTGAVIIFREEEERQRVNDSHKNT